MKQLNIMVIGAHPDDCEGGCGGIALKYIKEGSKVTFVSVTDGSAGHQTMDRKTLANVRSRTLSSLTESMIITRITERRHRLSRTVLIW